jgi:hypothetical protein
MAKKKKERDEKINCENYSLKINAENLNDHFINITKNVLDKIKSDNSSKNHTTTYSPFKLFQMSKLKYDIIFRNTSTGEIETIIKKTTFEGFVWL